MIRIVSFAIDETLLRQLDQWTKDKGRSRSCLLREAVAAYLVECDGADDPGAIANLVRQNSPDAISVELHEPRPVTRP
jgi:metal-responsive CopG/Arc/MetJ family transcriptional regulator